MELYIGGFAQGKYEYVLNKNGMKKERIVNQVHLWFRSLLKEEERTGIRAEQVILDFCSKHPDCVLICDEIGNGIVPVEKSEREYRERLGRMLIELANKSDHVERILCGIGQCLK